MQPLKQETNAGLLLTDKEGSLNSTRIKAASEATVLHTQTAQGLGLYWRVGNSNGKGHLLTDSLRE